MSKIIAVGILLIISPSLLSLADNVDSLSLVSNANNQFSVELYSKVASGKKNVVLSPFSCSTVLSMLLVGGKTDTATEINKALDYTSLSQNQINDGYSNIIPALNGQQNYTLDLANAIFVKKDFEILKDFKTKVQTYYKSNVFELEGAQQINKYAADNTNNRIPQVVTDDDLPKYTEIVLVNAIYFKGTWKTQFNRKMSRDGYFKNEVGGSTTTTFMHLEANFDYFESNILKSQVLVLQYVGETMKMIILLPKDSSQAISNTVSLLSSKSLLEAAKSASSNKVIVTLPKFTIDSSYNLVDPLKNSGMKLAFTDAADFSGVSDKEGIKVSKVLQRAFIKVDEEGSEAAAVTTVVGVRSAASIADPPDIITFTADHPFIFALYHGPTNSLLFIGKYSNSS